MKIFAKDETTTGSRLYYFEHDGVQTYIGSQPLPNICGDVDRIAMVASARCSMEDMLLALATAVSDAYGQKVEIDIPVSI